MRRWGSIGGLSAKLVAFRLFASACTDRGGECRCGLTRQLHAPSACHRDVAPRAQSFHDMVSGARARVASPAPGLTRGSPGRSDRVRRATSCGPHSAHSAGADVNRVNSRGAAFPRRV